MLRRPWPWLLVAALVVVPLTVAVPAGAAGVTAIQPIQPNQRFTGLVNGSPGPVVVRTFCPGPVSVDGGTGPAIGGQTVSVELGGHGGGNTGALGRVVRARFVEDAGVTFTFVRYGVAQAVPSTLRLPCDGTGSVRFEPFPGWGGRAAAAVVPVTYQNIAF